MTRESRLALEDPWLDFARNHSYIALDFRDWNAAKQLVDQFGDAVTGYKVGLELFHAAGHSAVEALVRAGKRVFLDVKLHDIPNTVKGALEAIKDLGVEMVNVHALGGRKMMEAAREALGNSRHRPLLIAVTVLTSLSDKDLAAIDLPPSNSLVRGLAKAGHDCGLDGVVASALDVRSIYQDLPRSFLTVVPGIRPEGTALHDQSRTLSPKSAVLEGASHLVLGRAVTEAVDRNGALLAIWQEMQAAAQRMGGN